MKAARATRSGADVLADCMARESVNVMGVVPARAEDVWARVRDFAGHWHPLVDRIYAEAGGGVRCFGVKGETGRYRERLTYFSDSDMAQRYEMLEGIAGAQSYRAVFEISEADETSCSIRWSAEIEADDPRAAEIAFGTKAVFEVGLEALRQSPRTASIEYRLDLPQLHLRTLTVRGFPGLVLTVGPCRPGPLVLFLHGIGGNRWNWDGQHLGQLQTAALDLRGYGGSELGHLQSTADDHCHDILRAMEHLNASKVVLCGLSYGAWIATSFAMRHPDRLAGLVLSGGCTGMSEAPAQERDAFFQSRQKPLDEGKSPADFAEGVVKVIAGPHADESVKAELHRSMSAISAATYRDAVHCFAHPGERFDFSRISCPVLLMTGEHDRLASPAEIRAVANRIHTASPRPDVRFEVIAGAGHVCNLEQPGRYNAILQEFLQRFTS
jgi:pimeloyl-ACP methyl ester carboxylesterase